MTNKERADDLVRRALARGAPRFQIGDRIVEPAYGCVGVVDAIFADLEAAIDKHAIMPGWYEVQAKPPKSTKLDYWYSVILEDGGALLVGEWDATRPH